MAEAEKNPIERRLEYLEGLWNTFAKEEEPRLLRFLVDDDGRRMVNVLIEMQQAEVGTIPDLFVRFDAPFADVASYPVDLLASLAAQYEDSREVIAEADLPCDWQCPSPSAGESSLVALIHACNSFCDYYHGRMMHLVLALTPVRIDDDAAWPSFLQSLVNVPLPPMLRVMVVDAVDRPMLDALATAEPVRARTVCPDLDMAGALEEIADGARGVGPGNDFRKLFVRLGNAARRGEVGAANGLAVAALRLTRKHKWPDLQVPVFMVLGALHLQLGNRDKALLAYQRAGGSARAAKAAGNPAAGKLVVQTGFAEAAALLAAERYAEAAKLYEGLVPLAKEETEPFLELEGWRMASYCHEMTDAPREAWRCGLAALDAAAALDPELRRNSTVPFLGRRLIDLVGRHHGDAKHVRDLRNRLEALIGPDWEQTLPSAAGKDAAA